MGRDRWGGDGVIRKICATLIGALLLIGVLSQNYGGTAAVLSVAIVLGAVIVAGLVARALRRAYKKVDQIFRDELDDDPDPFAMRRRVEYRDDPTDSNNTGETR